MKGWGLSFILGIILSVQAWAGGLPNDEYHTAYSFCAEMSPKHPVEPVDQRRVG